MVIFKLVKAHYKNKGGFFSFLRPFGDGVFSRIAGILFSLYALILIFLAFFSLFDIFSFMEKAFLPLYLLILDASVFFTSASFSYGLFHMSGEIRMLKSYPIEDKDFFFARLIELCADSVFPAFAAFLPLFIKAGGEGRLLSFIPLFLLSWFISSLITALLAMKLNRRLFIGFVTADAVLVSAFFLYSSLRKTDGQAVERISGLPFSTVFALLLFILLLFSAYKAFCSIDEENKADGRISYEPKTSGMLKTLFRCQIKGLLSDSTILIKVVVETILPPLLASIALFMMEGRMESLIIVFAYALLSSYSSLSSTSYSRDLCYRELLAPLPVPDKADISCRLLFHFIASCLFSSFFLLVILLLDGYKGIFVFLAFSYQIIHSLAIAILALRSDKKRIEKNACSMRLEGFQTNFCALKSFLFSFSLEVFSISISVLLGLKGSFLLLLSIFIDIFWGLFFLFRITKG